MQKKTTAQSLLMDLLAKRSHSEKELRAKLREKFSQEEVDAALNIAKERNWVQDEQELATQLVESLHKKRKGQVYIEHVLQEKGLPAVFFDQELEVEKALSVLADKTKGAANLTRQEKAKYSRFLAARGFAPATIRMALSDVTDDFE